MRRALGQVEFFFGEEEARPDEAGNGDLRVRRDGFCWWATRRKGEINT